MLDDLYEIENNGSKVLNRRKKDRSVCRESIRKKVPKTCLQKTGRDRHLHYVIKLKMILQVTELSPVSTTRVDGL